MGGELQMITVFGANGMLGRYICLYLSQFYKVTPLTRKDIDLANVTEYPKLFPIISNSQYIINCAGTIRPVVYTQDHATTTVINSFFPRYLTSIHPNVIHITTDCIYSGKQGKYTELDSCDVTDIYGLSKYYGEPELATVIRTSIIGEELENFRSLVEWAKTQKGQEVNGFTTHYWNGVTCLQLAKILKDHINSPFLKRGIQHIFSNDVSKAELVQMISDTFELNLRIIPTAVDYCDRTLRSIFLDCSNVPSLEVQLKELKDYSKNLH